MSTLKKQEGAKVPGDERLVSLLSMVAEVLSAERVTTVETLMVARQLMLSATVQLAHDNPQSDALAIIDRVAESLRQSARASLRPTLAQA